MGTDSGYEDRDRRRSIRWTQTIPVKFSLINGDSDYVRRKIQNASIHNISKLGVCLEVCGLDEVMVDELNAGKLKVFLEIELPGIKEPILALAKSVWLSKLGKEKWEPQDCYLIGLNFVDITAASVDIITDFILRSFSESSRK